MLLVLWAEVTEDRRQKDGLPDRHFPAAFVKSPNEISYGVEWKNNLEQNSFRVQCVFLDLLLVNELKIITG